MSASCRRSNGEATCAGCWPLLAGRSGGLTVPNTLAAQSGVPRTTLLRYLELLSTVFLIKAIPAWSGSQYDVRPVVAYDRDRLLAITGLGDDTHVRLRVQHHAKNQPQQGLVVDQHDGDGHDRALTADHIAISRPLPLTGAPSTGRALLICLLWVAGSLGAAAYTISKRDA